MELEDPEAGDLSVATCMVFVSTVAVLSMNWSFTSSNQLHTIILGTFSFAGDIALPSCRRPSLRMVDDSPSNHEVEPYKLFENR